MCEAGQIQALASPPIALERWERERSATEFPASLGCTQTFQAVTIMKSVPKVTPLDGTAIGSLEKCKHKDADSPRPSRARAWAPGRRALTVAAVVVHQDDLLEQVWRCALHGRVDGTQQHRERLVDEDEHDAHLWEAVGEREVPAPGKEND